MLTFVQLKLMANLMRATAHQWETCDKLTDHAALNASTTLGSEWTAWVYCLVGKIVHLERTLEIWHARVVCNQSRLKKILQSWKKVTTRRLGGTLVGRNLHFHFILASRVPCIY